MGKYQAYPEYKDSNISGLGSIPKNWEVMQLKRTVDSCVNGIWGSEPKENDADTIVLRVADFDRPRLIIKDAGYTFRYIDEKEKVSRKLKRGDLLLEKSGGGEKTLVGQVVLFDKDFEAVTSNFVAKMTPLYGFNSRFLNYVFSRFYSDRINFCSIKQNTGIQNLDSAAYLAEKFGFPQENEQAQIADFLDHETAKIDTLIDKQQQLIQLLKEKRQAVISHAVTKGLNPNAPMRESGVEWLGEVPEHWEIRAVSKLSQKITNGYVGPTRDILVPEGVPYIQATHIKKGKVNFDSAYFVRQSWSDAHAKSILVRGDVLIVQTGAGTGDIGLVTTSEEGFNCHALIIVQPVKSVISGEFLSMAFQSQYGYSVLYSIRTGGMHPHLNCGEVQFVKIPVPPINEQEEIIKHISEQVHKFDTLIGKQLLAIELMQERRTALISAAVTGKIDVRHHASRPAGNDTSEFSA
ncbi:MAG: restriction endonuclease subunit S [Pseudomonas sp.]|nr:restriction endonuclease subunit S [Pseudomonas sp.]